MKDNFYGGVWAGSVESYLHASESLSASFSADYSSFTSNPEEDEYKAYEIVGSVGVIPIKGSMVASAPNWACSMFGMATYQNIKSALVELADNPEVNSVLLDMDTPGGEVSGLLDVVDAVHRVNKEFKPVVAFARGSMCSGGYFIAAAAGARYGDLLSQVGSMGVISVHTEQTKQLERDGYKVRVFRSGEFKALGVPFEELTDKAADEIQSKADKVYKVLVGGAAKHLNLPYAHVDKHMAQGRVFVGEDALVAGLLDGITAIDNVVVKLQTIDNKGKAIQNVKGIRKFSERLVSTKVSNVNLGGNTVNILGLNASSAVDAAGQDQVLVAAMAAASAEEWAGAAATAADAAANVEAKAAETCGVVVQDSLVTYLQSEVKSKDAELRDIGVKFAEAQSKLAALDAVVPKLMSIASRSNNTMRVALNMPKLSYTGTSADSLLAEHDTLSREFAVKFPIGGVAASASDEASVGDVGLPNQLSPARLAAVRTKTKRKE